MMNDSGLVEREIALQQFADALERARKGRGGTLLVAGEGGIGKSALIEQAIKAAPCSLRVLRGGCEDLLSPRPLGPLSDIAHAQGWAFAEPSKDAAGTDSVFTAFLDAGPQLP